VAKLTRRDFLKASGGALAGAYVLGLAGCGTNGSESGTAQLRFMWWGPQVRHEKTFEVIDLFEKKHPDTRIAPDNTGPDAYQDKLATQTSGGNAPDIFQTELAFLAEYARRNALLDLNQFIPNTIDLSGWPEGILGTDTIDGKLYGISLGLNAYTTYYNATVLDEVGIEMPDQDWTWDDLTKLATEISEATKEGFYGTQDAGGVPETLEVFVRQRGKELYTESGNLGFDKEDLAEWFRYWDDMRRDGAAPPAQVTAETAPNVDNNPLVLGKTAVLLSGYSTQLAAYQSLLQDEIGIHMLPYGADGSSGQFVRSAQSLSAYSQTEFPERVATFINFFVNDPEAAQILEIVFGVPANPESRKLLEDSNDATIRTTLDYIELVSKNGTPLTIPRPLGNPEIELLLPRMNENVGFGRATIDEAVDQFFNEANQALKQA